MAAPARSAIQIDGTTLEGGGQLLRLALSLSSLTRLPFQITNIRGKRGSRSKSGKDGGMKPAHLAGAKWLAEMTQADTEGLQVRSRELLFKPRVSQGGGGKDDSDQPTAQDAAEAAGPGRPHASWQTRYHAGGDQPIRKYPTIAMSTPGSVFLILQAILPYILFTPPPTPPSTAPIPIRIEIQGGTNVWHSLSYDYASLVLLPLLATKLHLGPIAMTLNARSWSTGRPTVGSVTFTVTPLPHGSTLQPFVFADRGAVAKLHVALLAPCTLRSLLRTTTLAHLQAAYPGTTVAVATDEDSRDPRRLYLLVVAETAGGYRLGRDWLFDQKVTAETGERCVARLVKKVGDDLAMELAHGGCVDEFMEDQLVVFKALAQGKAKVEGGVASLHTRTARWVAEQMLGVKFKGGSCWGVGLKAGEGAWSESVAGAATAAEDVKLEATEKSLE